MLEVKVSCRYAYPFWGSSGAFAYKTGNEDQTKTALPFLFIIAIKAVGDNIIALVAELCI